VIFPNHQTPLNAFFVRGPVVSVVVIGGIAGTVSVAKQASGNQNQRLGGYCPSIRRDFTTMESGLP
jgi:hypothetical protein